MRRTAWLLLGLGAAVVQAAAQAPAVNPPLYAGLPGDPTAYYLRLPEGGVWKTSGGGTVWKPKPPDPIFSGSACQPKAVR